MMKKIKISELDNQALFELGLSKERHILFVDDIGIKKDNILALNELLKTRQDFFINISSEKDESNKNYISGNDLLTALSEMRNLIYHASLKYPLKNISIFANLINLRSLHLYGDLPKDMELKPLDNIENLESIYIENGLTLRQDVYLSMKSTIREIGAGIFRMESFDKNPNLKKIAVLTGVSHEEEMPKKLPELEELYIEKGKNIRSFNFISEMKTLKTLELNNIPTLKEIPDLSNLEDLTKVILTNLRSLENMDAILNHPRIRTLILENIKCFNVDMLSKETAPRLKYVSVISDDKNWDKRTKKLLEEKGYKDYNDN
ncbi:hypothetical protein [Brachyspira hyodysenteriae]|uniref:hypothetical protein n=1 Tax=Brachyspira hyodysenteriae TaxID=159 RepID=UPI001ADDA40E|nr:hypothetical protein [Brachyspira hyodysenteriae]MCZ9954971.1 hypothetical protein [Brachyspira hyodysenteriae]MDA0079484.1 hypothetical protein [Brachyspira hyodysenteriae]QTM07489.1 hypothetical protein GQX60_00995 [Brachyspira hyodysenteriae]